MINQALFKISSYNKEFKTIKLKVKAMNKLILREGFSKADEKFFNIYIEKLTYIYKKTNSKEVEEYLIYLKDLYNSYTMDYKIENNN